jgi:hypothetical protein
VSDFLSSLFDPFEIPTTIISDPFTSSPNIQPPSKLLSSFSWPDEPSAISVLSAPNFHLAPSVIPPLPIRNFSDLCSGANPWQSLRRRKRRDQRRSAQPFTQPIRRWPTYTSKFHAHIAVHPATYPTAPYPPPANLPAPLDWHSDPRLSELSHVLRSLGWVSPSTSRP